MDLIPALDLRWKKCIRLSQGVGAAVAVAECSRLRHNKSSLEVSVPLVPAARVRFHLDASSCIAVNANVNNTGQYRPNIGLDYCWHISAPSTHQRLLGCCLDALLDNSFLLRPDVF